MPTVYQDLQRFAADPNLNEKLKLAFGSDYNVQTAQTIVENWLLGDFSTIPPIEFVERGDIAGANGAFAAATNKIYLSKDILTGDITKTGAVEDVILEEIGHSIDVLVNAVDAPGDEGEIFAGVVKEKTFDAADLARLKAEDDSTKINLSGSDISIEMSQIPMASLNGRLYQSHRGNDNNIYTRSSTDGINWTNWNNNGGGATLNAPSLAAFNGRLYQSHRGFDNNIYTRSSSDGVNWSGWAQSGGATQSAPTLAAVNGRLYQSHRGFDNNIHTRSSTDGVNWSGWVQSGGGTPTAPTLAAYNGRLYQSHRGFDGNKMYTRSSTDGMNWTGWAESGGSTPSYPTIAEFNGRLYQSHRGYDSNLIYTRSSTDGVNWTGWTSINRSTPTAASMTAFNGKLYLTHQGLDDKIYMSSSTDGINWGQWIERGGATPTDSDNPPISSPPPTPVSGKYQLPYPDGKTYQVTQGNNNTTSSHYDTWNRYAWDFNMPEGSTVVATRGGKVVSLYEGSQTKLSSLNGWSQYTNYVLIDHGDGTSALYLHLKYNGVLPNVGDSVSQNQPIAQSGKTGYILGIPGDHLHYSVQKTPSNIPAGGFSNKSGGYLTESLPSSFSDPDVLRKNYNGVPTYPNNYTS
jgi:murein DD-endopeptidase MepM/ murein hydrolase activator NlpD